VAHAGTYGQLRGKSAASASRSGGSGKPRIPQVGRSVTASLQATRSAAEMENPSEAERDTTDPPNGQYDPDEGCRSVRGAQDHRGRSQQQQRPTAHATTPARERLSAPGPISRRLSIRLRVAFRTSPLRPGSSRSAPAACEQEVGDCRRISNRLACPFDDDQRGATSQRPASANVGTAAIWMT
jgi:hypothetical protein